MKIRIISCIIFYRVASELWGKTLKERVCVDVSTEINDLAENIVKSANPPINGTHFYRQYLPVASVVNSNYLIIQTIATINNNSLFFLFSQPTYDIVVSAFTLFELPSRKTRIETIASLWRKTEKYLVLIDLGSKSGFKVCIIFFLFYLN